MDPFSPHWFVTLDSLQISCKTQPSIYETFFFLLVHHSAWELFEKNQRHRYSLRFKISPVGSAISKLGLQLMPVFLEVREPLGGRPGWRDNSLYLWEDGPGGPASYLSGLPDPPRCGWMASSSQLPLPQPRASFDAFLPTTGHTLKEQTTLNPLFP